MPRPRFRSVPLVVLAALLLLGTVACEQEAKPPPPDPNRIVWKQMGMLCAENTLTRIALLRVEDQVEGSADVERQVGQAILTELTQLPDLQVIETDPAALKAAMAKHKDDLAVGIPPAMAMELCQSMSVDAFVFATVENTEFDVALKLYTGATGNLVFAKTLEDLKLPGAPAPKSKPVPTGETAATEVAATNAADTKS